MGTGPGAEVAAVGDNVVGNVGNVGISVEVADVGTVVGSAVVGSVVGAAVVGSTVVGAVVGAVVVGAVVVGAEVSVGVARAASAIPCVAPKGVKMRATETTRATGTAGYATTARRRYRRVGPLLMRFTGTLWGCGHGVCVTSLGMAEAGPDGDLPTPHVCFLSS